MRMSYDAVQLVTTLVRGFYDEARLFDLLQPHLDARISLVDDGPITHANLRLNGRELRQHGELTEGLSLREHLASLSTGSRDREVGAISARSVLLRVVFLLHISGLLTFVSPTPGQRPPRRRS